ncbi:SpoIIE family protein phosphatase [Parvicella tangerina]|uniref:PPM-type phosphatase domain-containing protein n=1 Tax=Parvicella tangerina TaxID=2829795 RepID=A0A916JN30_9FLAO|nr:SpoIIE family protein phosphatase [Parvicella tangerina]CAG5082113.1 hypothetical protein CRYO30217_01811 [Parvicella tangerina]
MIRSLTLVILLLIIEFSSLHETFGQLVSNHKVIYYAAKTYKGHNQTWQAAQTENGVMYFANGNGLLFFDGVEWDLVNTAKETNMLSIAIDQDERIYYGAIGEVGYFEKNERGELTPVQITNEEYATTLSTEFYWGVHLFDDKVVFRSEHLWLVYENGETEVFPVEEHAIKSSYQIGEYIWVQDKYSSIYKIHHDSLKYFSEDYIVESLSNQLNGVSVQGLAQYEEDKIMMTGQGIKLVIYDENTNTVEHFDSQLDDIVEPGFYLNDLEIFPDQRIGVSTTTHGIFILNKYGNIVSAYNEENGLSSNAVRNMYYDREGLLWLTSDVGIYKILFNKNYTLLSEQFEQVSGVSNAIVEYHDQLVIATNEHVFFIKNKEGFLTTSSIPGFNEQSFDLLEVDGELFCATTSGLHRYNGKDFDQLSPKYARALVEVGPNYLLVGGRKELFLWKKVNGLWQLKKSQDFPDEFLHLEKDPTSSNVFWGGFYSAGIARIKIDTTQNTIVYKHYDQELTGQAGYVLPFSIQDRMIFAPKAEQIWRYDKETDQFVEDDFTADLLKQEFSSWLIKEDIYGNLFYEASGPVYFCRKTDDGYEVDTTSLAHLNVGFINDIFCSETGETWLVGEENIVRFNPHQEQSVNVNTQVLLKRITVNGDSILFEGLLNEDDDLLSKQPIFDYAFNNISFDFVSAFHTDEEPLLYSYQLEGNDKGFSPWATDRKAIYTNLPEGDYTFLVKAKNAEGTESEVFAYSFTILPPWYRTWYAYGFFLFSLALIVVVIVKLNSLRLRKANDNLQRLVDEKTEEISLNLKEISVQRDQLEERNKDIIDSINYAQRLQNAILPSKDSIDKIFPKNFVLYLPKDIVAGDFYWLQTVSDNAFIAAADCTGHGVPGALVSVVCNDALNQAANEFKLDQPDLILNTVNDLVRKRFSSADEQTDDMKVRDGMDIALSHINTVTREVVFAGAHNSLWVLSSHDYGNDARRVGADDAFSIYELKADRQPIGSGNLEKPFTRQVIRLKAGDRLYMFTDGIIDQFGGESFGKLKKFKRKNLIRLLFETRELSMTDQRIAIFKAFEQWKGQEEQLDDVTIIGIEL